VIVRHDVTHDDQLGEILTPAIVGQRPQQGLERVRSSQAAQCHETRRLGLEREHEHGHRGDGVRALLWADEPSPVARRVIQQDKGCEMRLQRHDPFGTEDRQHLVAHRLLRREMDERRLGELPRIGRPPDLPSVRVEDEGHRARPYRP